MYYKKDEQPSIFYFLNPYQPIRSLSSLDWNTKEHRNKSFFNRIRSIYNLSIICLCRHRWRKSTFGFNSDSFTHFSCHSCAWVAQTISNFGKAYFGRTKIVWRLTTLFLLGALIGTEAGVLLWSFNPVTINQILLGLFLLVSTWRPEWLRLEKMQLWISAAVSSVITVFSGATGPIVMTMLPTKKLSKQQTIATHGAIMTLHHSVKTVGFILIGFSVSDYIPLMIVILAASWCDSYIGNKALIKLPESHIKRLIKLILTLLALHLILKERLTFL